MVYLETRTMLSMIYVAIKYDAGGAENPRFKMFSTRVYGSQEPA